MIAVVHVAGWVLLGISGLGGVYALAAGLLVRRFLKTGATAASDSPAVSLLKPLHGAEPDLAANLATFCGQNYPGAVQILFGVQDEDDPAADVVRALQRAHPALDIVLVVDPRRHGANAKISNVINIAARARHDVLVLSDSDIAVAPDYLSRVTTALAQDGVGAVSLLYVGRPVAGVWSTLSAMAISYQFLPNAVLGRALGMASPCFGSTIAISRPVLSRIGGFEAFADLLADDYEIGRAVRAAGLTVAIPPMVVTHACDETTAAELIDHELRWGVTIRLIDGAGYAGSLVTHALPLALIGAAMTGAAPLALIVAGIVFATRLALKALVGSATSTSAGRWWLLPVRDVLSFAVFVWSFAVSSVAWRGRRFRVSSDGALSSP